MSRQSKNIQKKDPDFFSYILFSFLDKNIPMFLCRKNGKKYKYIYLKKYVDFTQILLGRRS